MSDPGDEFERRFARRYAEYLGHGVGEPGTRQVKVHVGADGPRRVGRRRMAVVATATVALAAAITLAAVAALPRISGPTGVSSASEQASDNPSGTPARTPDATPAPSTEVPWPTVAASEVSVPSSLDGQDFAFWTIDWQRPCCGSSLRIATSTGSWDHVIDIPPELMAPRVGPNGTEYAPMPAGPANGRIVYIVDDGRTAQLRMEDARTGVNTELTSTTHVIGRPVIDPSGSTVYYLLFDRLTGAFQGLWAVGTGGGQPSPLIEVQATTVSVTLAAERVYPDQLAVSTDGRWIVFVRCLPTGCDFRAHHPDGTAQLGDWSNFHVGDEIVGVAGDLLIGATDCMQPICDGFALDLRTGERWPLGGTTHPFAPHRLIAGPHGPLALREVPGVEPGVWRVEALDLTDGTRSDVYEGTFGLAKRWDEARAELPPGWFLMYRFDDATPLPPPDYGAATAGATSATELPFMAYSQP